MKFNDTIGRLLNNSYRRTLFKRLKVFLKKRRKRTWVEGNYAQDLAEKFGGRH